MARWQPLCLCLCLLPWPAGMLTATACLRRLCDGGGGGPGPCLWQHCTLTPPPALHTVHGSLRSFSKSRSAAALHPERRGSPASGCGAKSTTLGSERWQK